MALPAVFNGWLAVTSINQYRDRVHKGQNPIMAALIEGAALAPNFLLSPTALVVTGLGLPLARASTAAIVGAVREHNNFIRQAKTPFSHRFEHTDTTARAQMLGLQQIGAAWGHARMGSEAAMFASRYGR
jgi:hypothetical protein